MRLSKHNLSTMLLCSIILHVMFFARVIRSKTHIIRIRVSTVMTAVLEIFPALYEYSFRGNEVTLLAPLSNLGSAGWQNARLTGTRSRLVSCEHLANLIG